MTPTVAQTELSILLSDTLTQVSGDRLSQAIVQAWRDPWVSYRVFDTTSLVYSASVYQYIIPTTMTVVDAIYLQRSTALPPQEISSELWEIVNGYIVFSQKASFVIPDAYALQVRGRYKIPVGATLPTTDLPLQNYVINMAAWIVLKQVAMSKALSFLKNDTSMAELIGLRNQVQQDMLGYRSQLQMAYVNN